MRCATRSPCLPKPSTVSRYSWGGFESLILPCDISAVRSVRPWQYGDGYGATVRLHIGLEDVDDLLDDLDQGFAAMHAANQN